MSWELPNWQIQSIMNPPEWLVQEVIRHMPGLSGRYAAQLLWQRKIREPDQLAGFLNPQFYQPASPFEFGQEMQWAVKRLQHARNHQEVVAIWGDFDADGITATAVLWDGLGQFFAQNRQLIYYIPNRLTESHGLSYQGIDALTAQGCRLIVTCDTGSTNLDEIEYVQNLGIDVIITDHHTLPAERPPVTAIINPRYLPTDHPLANLSGVAVAYKLVEALYKVLPDVPQQSLDYLLDLVAIGLIADLVELRGDCRYLAQRGIEQLQQQLTQRTRPGVARLLELCKKNGDRPTDISFGLGPRINAVSRIQGDARFCVELLTSQDTQRCHQLAAATELANGRRKSLQKDVTEQVRKKLQQLDLSTTSVIVLFEPHWPVGVLGLVAGQIAQDYSRPVILLSTNSSDISSMSDGTYPDTSLLARGSARSVNQIDLYQLVKAQTHLLHRFGGHPFAAGLSLPVENVPLFTEAINQQQRQQAGAVSTATVIQADLVVTVVDLGKDLFRELKLLEPCGMGNPVPKLLIQNCWFERVRNENIRDARGQKLRYIKTEFEIWDESNSVGFPGIWWEHRKEEIPQGRCDAIAELDYNTYRKHYEVRLIAVRPCLEDTQVDPRAEATSPAVDWILDWRQISPQDIPANEPVLQVTQCPATWQDLQGWFQRALQTNQKLAIAYHPPSSIEPLQIWEQLIGIAKYLHRTGQSATCLQVQETLGIRGRSLALGFEALNALGFTVQHLDHVLQVTNSPQTTGPDANPESRIIEHFLAAVYEEQFCHHYFSKVPLTTIQAVAQQMS